MHDALVKALTRALELKPDPAVMKWPVAVVPSRRAKTIRATSTRRRRRSRAWTAAAGSRGMPGNRQESVLVPE